MSVANKPVRPPKGPVSPENMLDALSGYNLDWHCRPFCEAGD